MISFTQVLTAQWSNTIPCWNVWFQVRITSHNIPFQHFMGILPDPSFLLQHSWLLWGFKAPSLNSTFLFRQVPSFYEPDFSHTLELFNSLVSFIHLRILCLPISFLWNPFSLPSLASSYLIWYFCFSWPILFSFSLILEELSSLGHLSRCFFPHFSFSCSWLILCPILFISFCAGFLIVLPIIWHIWLFSPSFFLSVILPSLF